MKHRAVRFEIDRPTATAGAALVFSIGVLGGGLLWLRFGDGIAFERLAALLANCF